MAKWSSLWTATMNKTQRAEAIRTARFTPPSRPKGTAKQAPGKQPFQPKKD